jgi:cell division protein FtsQ
MACGLIVLGALALGTYKYVLEPSTLRVKHVMFDGNSVLSGQDLLEAAQITEADTILSVKPDVVRKRVLALPYVKDCAVSRSLPSTIVIRIVERVPVAALMVNNRVYEVDRDGMVLREVPPLAPPNGPLVTNLPDLSAVAAGQMVKNPALDKALMLWDAFSADPLAKELTLSEISAQTESMLYMYFNELPFETRWGRSDFATQVHRFDLLWREKSGKLPCIEFLDMRFDNNIVCQ